MATNVARKQQTQSLANAPVLRLRVRGPGVRSGRISVPDLIRICQETQNAVTRQAEALEGRKTIHPGPTTQLIRHECTLELVAIRKGSTTLEFALAKPQLFLPLEEVGTFATTVVQELADTIKSLGNGNKKTNIDPGVLGSIYGLGSVVAPKRITGVEWISPKRDGRQQIRAIVDTIVRERAAKRLSSPTKVSRFVDGILDMADFRPRDRKCRIDPAIGTPVMCSFRPEDEHVIQTLLRQPVRASGIATIQPYTGRIELLDISSIEALPSLSLGEGNFLASQSIQQLIEAQSVKPIRDISRFAGIIPDDEIDDFVSDIYQSRKTP